MSSVVLSSGSEGVEWREPGRRSVDDTGKRFGMLVAIRDVGVKNNRRAWLYKCDCGKQVIRDRASTAQIAKKGTPSCGCALSTIRAGNGRKNKRHGFGGTLLYHVWRQMLQRCENPSCKDYPLYGARGIYVCDEWRDIATFVDWAQGSGYQRGLTIERVDNNDGYRPGNCRWIPNEQQAWNTRRLILLTCDGETRHASEWARITGLSLRTIISRKRYGWTDQQAIKTPVGGQR